MTANDRSPGCTRGFTDQHNTLIKENELMNTVAPKNNNAPLTGHHAADPFRVGEHALLVTIERTDERHAVTVGTPKIVVVGDTDYLTAADARAYAWALQKAAVQLDAITGTRVFHPEEVEDPLDLSEPTYERVRTGNELVDVAWHLIDFDDRGWHVENDPHIDDIGVEALRAYIDDLTALAVTYEAIGSVAADLS